MDAFRDWQRTLAQRTGVSLNAWIKTQTTASIVLLIAGIYPRQQIYFPDSYAYLNWLRCGVLPVSS